MSAKVYWSLWGVFAFAAGVMWLAGALTMLTAVVFGFIAFGLIFTGMMCVLPAVVSHPPVQAAKAHHEADLDPAMRLVRVGRLRQHFPLALRFR